MSPVLVEMLTMPERGPAAACKMGLQLQADPEQQEAFAEQRKPSPVVKEEAQAPEQASKDTKCWQNKR